MPPVTLSVGNAGLRHFVEFFLHRIRYDSDVIARTGGDEFSMIINAPEDQVKIMLDRYRKDFIKEGFTYEDPKSHKKTEYYLSFSYGTSQLDPTNPDLSATIEASDAAMYKDKETKKDRMDNVRALYPQRFSHFQQTAVGKISIKRQGTMASVVKTIFICHKSLRNFTRIVKS